MHTLPPEIIEKIQEYVFDFHAEYNMVLREMRSFIIKQNETNKKILPKFIKGRHVITYS